MITSPIPGDMSEECVKAAKVLNSFLKLNPAKQGSLDAAVIPPQIIAKARGLAILTVIKAGFIWSGRAGTGLVVARLSDGSWSAPSGIHTLGAGVGGQIGAELTNFIIVLNTEDAVKAFSHGGNVTLGGNLSVAAGPLGRTAEVAGTAGNLAAIFSYSKTKGLFAGVSLEGSVIMERKDANEKFYKQKISAKHILDGSVPRPDCGTELYKALHRITIGDFGHRPVGVAVTGQQASQPQQSHNQVSPDSKVSTLAMAPPAYNSSTNIANARSALTAPPPAADSKRPSVPPRLVTAGEVVAVALYDFNAERADDLAFRQGDYIVITRQTGNTNDWWSGRLASDGPAGKIGSFPANYVQLK